MTVYICGPISGLPDYNRPAFESAAAYLRSIGHDPVVPLAEVVDPAKTWEDWMREAIVKMLGCEALYVLPGWEASRGACIEVRLALDLGVPVIHA